MLGPSHWELMLEAVYEKCERMDRGSPKYSQLQMLWRLLAAMNNMKRFILEVERDY
jgi:hypothetical protein